MFFACRVSEAGTSNTISPTRPISLVTHRYLQDIKSATNLQECWSFDVCKKSKKILQQSTWRLVQWPVCDFGWFAYTFAPAFAIW